MKLLDKLNELNGTPNLIKKRLVLKQKKEQDQKIKKDD